MAEEVVDGAADDYFYDRAGAVAAADYEITFVLIGGGQDGGAGGGLFVDDVGGFHIVQLQVFASSGPSACPCGALFRTACTCYPSLAWARAKACL